jgi:hypothetical protein
VASYQVEPEYGGEDGLEIFRRKLNAAGLKLVLDFVPNHTGIDHSWLKERPELFVRSNEEREGTFAVESGGNLDFIAHGRDPYFLPWIDTAQLDYRKQTTHNAMSDALMSVAERCDGVRCDMAMLVLREVFQRTWEKFPTDAAAQDEFWPGAIRRVKERFPGFMFLAEAYWSLEPKLIEMGFDYAYDKVLYDLLVRGDPREICTHIYSQPARQLEHSAHFIENHDEQRAAAVLTLDRHRAAAMLVLALPGMCLLHEGQLVGAKERVPVQATTRPVEPPNPEVQAVYDELLEAIGRSDIGKGNWKLVTFEPGNSRVVGIHWTETSAVGALLSPGTLAVVNLAQAVVGVSLPQVISGAGWSLLGQVEGASLSMSATGPAKLSLPPRGWALLQTAQAQVRSAGL